MDVHFSLKESCTYALQDRSFMYAQKLSEHIPLQDPSLAFIMPRWLNQALEALEAGLEEIFTFQNSAPLQLFALTATFPQFRDLQRNGQKLWQESSPAIDNPPTLDIAGYNCEGYRL